MAKGGKKIPKAGEASTSGIQKKVTPRIHTRKNVKSKSSARIKNKNEVHRRSLEADRIKKEHRQSLKAQRAIEEEALIIRRQLVSEQNEEYRQSLEADRAKEELKNKLESERQAAEEKLKELQESALERLPKEPESDEQETIMIRFKTPEGTHFDRRFHTHSTIQTLLDYLTSQGYTQEEYKIMSGWPRTDITDINEKSLHSLKFYPKEYLIIEKRSSD